jgi:hypothetical protein
MESSSRNNCRVAAGLRLPNQTIMRPLELAVLLKCLRQMLGYLNKHSAELVLVMMTKKFLPENVRRPSKPC